MLAAYVDESGNNDLFTLSCLVADFQAWVWFDLDWRQCLDEKNVQLLSEGRNPISRYDAADASSRVGEFEGWLPQEVAEFFTKLLDVFRQAHHQYGCLYPQPRGFRG